VCWFKDLHNKNVFSLDLKTDSESLPMTDAGSELQTCGTEHETVSRSQCKRMAG